VTAQELRGYKQDIRAFLRVAYTDEQLCALLAHAQSGRLVYFSCCCLIGIPTAKHPLKGKTEYYGYPDHSEVFRGNDEGIASLAFSRLGSDESGYIFSDELRRRRIIPIVRAEIHRRDKLRQQSTLESETKMERTDGILQAV
jgi:hypothetical protein